MKKQLLTAMFFLLCYCSYSIIMPPPADWDAEYADFLKEVEVPTDSVPEFFKINFTYSQSPVGRIEFNDAFISADMVSPTNRNWLRNYIYTIAEHCIKGNPSTITLTEGNSSGLTVDKHEYFAEVPYTCDFFSITYRNGSHL